MAKTSKVSNNSSLKLFRLFLVLLAINIIAIDVWIVYTLFQPKNNVLGEATACPQSCINYINGASTGSSGSKEYYVPLGTGTNQTDVWADVAGAQVYIDSSQYRKIKKVTFEATLEIPHSAQISYIRLYNVTDMHPVWYSEVSMEGSGPQLLTSDDITLDSGRKLYQVQMKSQLKSLINLVQSRVHILTY